MDNQALQQIKDIIDQHEQVFIAVGNQPQIDEMAAALSLYLSFEKAGKKVSIAATSEPLVEHSSLVGIDKVSSGFQGSGGDLVVSFPYKEEGEIEKVSYTLDSGFLNIIVKPGEQGFSFTENDVRFAHGGGLSGLLVTVGTPRLSDFGDLLPQDKLKETTIINIDNKEENENYGNVVLVSPKFSSVSEQVADLLLSLGYDFDVDTAQNLLNGISAATQNFQQENTSYLAFEIAAILLRKGAKRPEAIQMQHQPRLQRQSNQHENRQQRPVQTQRPLNERMVQNTPDEQNQEQRPGQQNNNQRQQQAIRQQLQQHADQQKTEEDLTPPADWLTPKVYKGSTNI